MSRIIDADLENKLRGVDDGNPDYANMRKRIVLEVEKRRSGWSETRAEVANPGKRSRVIYTAAGALACAAAAGILLSQQTFAPDPASEPAPNAALTETAYKAPAGQSVEQSAVVDGVTLKLENAIQGRFEGADTGETQKDRLALQLSLSGLNVPNAEYAGFASTTLTDLTSGKSQKLRGPGFDLRQGMQNVLDSQIFDGDWAGAGETRRFRFETSDLYTVKRLDIPLQGTMRDHAEYPISSIAGASVMLESMQWDEEQELLTLNYELRGVDAEAASAYPESLSAETQTMLLLNTGKTTIEPTSGTREGSRFSRSYELYGMSKQEREALTLIYSYPETVKKIEGTWKVDFALDGDQAQEKAVKVAVQNTEEVRQKTGWTLGEAAVGAYGVYLPIERAPEDRVLREGMVLGYEESTLTAESFETDRAEHPGNPLLAGDDPSAAEQEALSFRLMSEEVRDLSKGPLSIRLQNAEVVRRAPDDFWTALTGARSEEQGQERRIEARLPDGSLLHYRYSREGDDLKVVTETQAHLKLLQGTVLKANGELLQPDADASRSLYRTQGDYRVDVYKDIYRSVPRDAELSIGLGLYSQVDPSLDTEIVLRK
ncbi:hypothetical protein CDO73_00790 [Saccharibacillus sp. O23]|uniref:hypothetical protein n=1 Tax=Saccharibacillus sp. O23 TaxID=2009338 RepID=UPI000B4E2A97|nr:hypothetical protein [Saccharibacillus sp. O23]OWR33077.1 hypothetical protein CDO73_00790 [Saccharibacillus sp. O23]